MKQNITTIYFVRHAAADQRIQDDALRPLSKEGLQQRAYITAYFSDKELAALFASPYKRAYDTLLPLAEERNLSIVKVFDFRERKIAEEWILDFKTFAQRQWEDFSYQLPGGESLKEVQARNMKALLRILEEYAGKAVAIGTHGAALSTILAYYDPTFGYEEFMALIPKTPCIVKMEFAEKKRIHIETIYF